MKIKAIETTYRVTTNIGEKETEYNVIISDDVHKTVEIYARDTEGDFTVRLVDSTFDELFVLKNIIEEIINIDGINKLISSYDDKLYLIVKDKIFSDEYKIIPDEEKEKSETLIIQEQDPGPDQEPAPEIIPPSDEETLIKDTPDNPPSLMHLSAAAINTLNSIAYIRVEANKNSIYFSAAAAKLLVLKKDDRFYITGNLYFKIVISETEGSKVCHDTKNNAFKAHCPEFVDILLKAGAQKFEFGEFHEGCYKLNPIIK